MPKSGTKYVIHCKYDTARPHCRKNDAPVISMRVVLNSGPHLETTPLAHHRERTCLTRRRRAGRRRDRLLRNSLTESEASACRSHFIFTIEIRCAVQAASGGVVSPSPTGGAPVVGHHPILH